MSQLSLANIIGISVSDTPRGSGLYNTSNLALISNEQPLTAFEDGYKLYLSASEVATDFTTNSPVAALANTIFSQSPNILTGGGYLAIIPTDTTTSEDYATAVTRTSSLVQYFGIITDEISTDASTLAVSAVVQPLNKMYFPAFKASTDVDADTGIVDRIRLASYTKTRPLLYLTDTSDDVAATNFAAAYAARALSTNFAGSNTTQTMHLKDLVGVEPDLAMTQTIFTLALAAGADTYSSFQGVPKVFSTGTNGFFDEVYNQCWLVGALEIAGFNYLAQSSTKIAQSEAGISGLKSAYRAVLEQAIANQYIAAGSWTSSDTFGNLEDFKRNIQDRGYYIYSLPVNQQSAADRADRKAPIIQVAVKAAGAVHSSSVIVYINA